MTRRQSAAAAPAAPPAVALTPAAARRRDREDRIPRDARALLAQFGERASSVKVWRWNAEAEQYEYVRTIPATEFSEDRLQAKYGGGKYRGDILDGANKYVGSVPAFAIAGDPMPIRGNVPAAAHAPESTAVARLELIVAGMAESVRGLAEAMRAQSSGGGSRMAELREMAETLKAIAPAPAPAAAAATSPIQAVRDMLDAAELLGMNRGGNGTTDWVAVAEKTVTPLVGVLSDQIALNRENMLRRRNPAAAALAAPAAHAPAPGSIGAIVADLPAMARDYLAGCAAQDKDPALYAETVLDALPGDVLDGDESRSVPPLAVLLAADDAVAQLVAAVPSWAPHAEWIARLVAAMRASLAESAAEASA